ncbi:MAG TPA: hypothetical protein VJ547_11870 [Candidatus Thermoplasmatota archaeon]|nr:hypothetical protein [Candidatus Thermoplasmatota archaeon]
MTGKWDWICTGFCHYGGSLKTFRTAREAERAALAHARRCALDRGGVFTVEVCRRGPRGRKEKSYHVATRDMVKYVKEHRHEDDRAQEVALDLGFIETRKAGA